MCIRDSGFHRESTALNDTDMKYLLLYLEETYGLTNEKKIDNAIGIVANENKYHPIRDYLIALVWDGTERIRFCLRHFLGADADDSVSYTHLCPSALIVLPDLSLCLCGVPKGVPVCLLQLSWAHAPFPVSYTHL